jgi:glycosyltransferase involved in cell wall biosynthesis
VVDDCSTENILSVVNHFENSKIFYKRSDRKGNANICRNIGINNSTGEFIAMLDSDDEWLPDHLERSIETLKELQVDGIFGSFYVNDGIESKPYLNRPLSPGEDMVNYILSGNSTATPTHLYRAECIKKIMWEEKLHRNQDYDLIIRYSDMYKIAVVHLLTVIVHWQKGVIREHHLPSQMLFLERYKERMTIKNFVRLNMENYNALNHSKANRVKLKTFKSNVKQNIKHVNFIDFMTCFGSKNSVFNRLMLRINYVLRVLLS